MMTAMMSVGFVSCGGSDDENTIDPPQPPTYSINVNGSGSTNLTFNGSFDGKAGIDYKQSVKVVSNTQWNASIEYKTSGQSDWLSISPSNGNGDITVEIYPKSQNENVEERTATITLSGSGASATIEVVQKSYKYDGYVLPANEIALYNRLCWEYSGYNDPNKFQYILLSENDYKRMTNNELLARVQQAEVLKYDDGWLSTFGSDSNNNKLVSGTTYYFVSLAYDKNDEVGVLKTKTYTLPEYKDENNDAWVSFGSFSYNSSGFKFTTTKKGLCDSYHIIYGNSYETNNSAVFAFEINYYLKNQKKHWLAKNDYWEWEIITNYPNSDTFSYSSNMMSALPVCFAYGWGMFKNGSLSSDLVGFQTDISTSSAPKFRVARSEENVDNMTIKRSEVLSEAKMSLK